MRMLGTVDLEVLHVAIGAGGTFNEGDLERSDLKRLGVGRVLDALASLKDRGMISLNPGGTFSITEKARAVLWSLDVPEWARILRLLHVRSCSMEQVADILGIERDGLEQAMDELRRQQYVLMSPQRRDGRLVRMYEILPDGVQRIDRTESEGFGDATPADPETAADMIDGILAAVRKSSMGQEEKDSISARIDALKKRLNA